MKKIFFIFAVLLLAFAVNANAALVNNGDGTITDTDLSIMWLQDANYAGSAMTWADAMTWAGGLTYGGYDDWRLPTSDTSCSGYNCTGSEMGHLYYIEGIKASSPGEFSNLQSSMYWSGTQDTDPSKAWRFSFNYGNQVIDYAVLPRYALAVRDVSDIPVVPEPISSMLFLSGALTIGAWRKIRGK